MKTTVIHHSADFDGLFCREIARKFLPDAELIGWDFSDKPIDLRGTEPGDQIIVMDLPLDAPFGLKMHPLAGENRETGFPDSIVWIDHHASAIASHPKNILGYRIDGVAACRLAWQWFANPEGPNGKYGKHGYGSAMGLPKKEDFVGRTVSEPFAVRLAGEYDIWDKRDPDAELFQHGLRTCPISEQLWSELLSDEPHVVESLLEDGTILEYAREQEYAEVIKGQGFDVDFEGFKFLACNSHELDIRSHLFAAGVRPHHDALLGFTFNGKDWRISLYHAPGKEHHDLSQIAVKYGGGGHRGAGGFRTAELPFFILG